MTNNNNNINNDNHPKKTTTTKDLHQPRPPPLINNTTLLQQHYNNTTTTATHKKRATRPHASLGPSVALGCSCSGPSAIRGLGPRSQWLAGPFFCAPQKDRKLSKKPAFRHKHFVICGPKAPESGTFSLGFGRGLVRTTIAGPREETNYGPRSTNQSAKKRARRLMCRPVGRRTIKRVFARFLPNPIPAF